MESFVSVARDGAEIESYYWPGGPVAVLLCHGKAYDRDSFVAYAEVLAGNGYAAAALNFRGYGGSRTGSGGADAIGLDVEAVAKQLRDRGHLVVALGASRGGGAVLNAAVDAPDVIAGLITWSTVAIADDRARRLPRIPKLMIVSAREMMRGQTLSVYEASPPPKTLVEMEGGRHAQQIWLGPARAELEAHVAAFLTAQFG